MADNLTSSNSSKDRTEYFRSRSTWFACILYPDEDSRHQDFMNYMLNYPFARGLYPKYVYITHDRDTYSDDVIDDSGFLHPKGSLKKKHVHFLFSYHRSTALSHIQKSLVIWVSHVESVSDYLSYLHYMLHVDTASYIQGKPVYDVSELHGTESVIRQVIIQNANCVYFEEIVDLIQKGQSVSDILLYARERYPPDMQRDFTLEFERHRSLFLEVIREKKRERAEADFAFAFFDGVKDSGEEYHNFFKKSNHRFYEEKANYMKSLGL